jgi:DNA adenine methylase
VAAARPLLKWAGGKRQLLPALRRFYPRTFTSYREPFLGSGAVFFDLHAQGLLAGRDAIISDNNPDLIACYLAVRDSPDEVVRELSRLASAHQLGGTTHYYAVRNEQFNPLRAARASSNGRDRHYTAALAAMFIYLNRTGYNGLFRLNSDGDFNVPAGRYSRPRICDAVNLHRVAAVLGSPRVSIERARFDTVADTARPGDFLYFDPPYAPVSRTARFTAYTTEGFDAAAQQRLRDILITLAARGCQVVMSNSTAPDITMLYEESADVKAAGLTCHRIPARRAINSDASRRGTVEEYVITNVPEA